MSGELTARPPRASAIATGRGDDGTTGLLYGGDRIPKDDLRTEAYGTLDEAVAALGMARAELELKRQLDVLPPGLDQIATIILRIQRELFVAGAELAANPAAWDRLRDDATRVSAGMVAGIDALLEDYEARIAFPNEFVVPGETRTSAALELARTILRRAERRSRHPGACRARSRRHTSCRTSTAWRTCSGSLPGRPSRPRLAQQPPRELAARHPAGPADRRISGSGRRRSLLIVGILSGSGSRAPDLTMETHQR